LVRTGALALVGYLIMGPVKRLVLVADPHLAMSVAG